MLPIEMFSEIVGIDIEIEEVQYGKFDWLTKFLTNVKNRKEEQWLDESNDIHSRDKFGQMYWLGQFKDRQHHLDDQEKFDPFVEL